jgi:hypothetical protein
MFSLVWNRYGRASVIVTSEWSGLRAGRHLIPWAGRLALSRVSVVPVRTVVAAVSARDSCASHRSGAGLRRAGRRRCSRR